MAYIESFNGKTPRIHESAIIAPTAVLIGDVTVDEGVSIWPNTVVRGDFAPIYIGAYTNIQDNSTVHADLDTPLCIESYVLIGHNSMIHGIHIGTCTLIGMSSCISVQVRFCLKANVLPTGRSFSAVPRVLSGNLTMRLSHGRSMRSCGIMILPYSIPAGKYKITGCK